MRTWGGVRRARPSARAQASPSCRRRPGTLMVVAAAESAAAGGGGRQRLGEATTRRRPRAGPGRRLPTRRPAASVFEFQSWGSAATPRRAADTSSVAPSGARAGVPQPAAHGRSGGVGEQILILTSVGGWRPRPARPPRASSCAAAQKNTRKSVEGRRGIVGSSPPLVTAAGGTSTPPTLQQSRGGTPPPRPVEGEAWSARVRGHPSTDSSTAAWVLRRAASDAAVGRAAVVTPQTRPEGHSLPSHRRPPCGRRSGSPKLGSAEPPTAAAATFRRPDLRRNSGLTGD